MEYETKKNEETIDGKNFFLKARNEVDSWFLINHTWPIVLILTSYASFIYIDLKFFKKRKPMDLKFIMFLFNIYQVVTNARMVYMGLLPDSLDYLFNHACHPTDREQNPLCSRAFLGGQLFLTSKLFDLLDTVFIVLRKKESQVSFLHLYHHFSMVIFAWWCLKYIPGEQLIIIMIVNPFVHIIMYSYYALTIFGEPIRKYLWWKKYITSLQMFQLAIYMGYTGILLLFGCNHSKPLTLFVFLQGVIFYGLFRDFYIKHYNKEKILSDDATNKKAKAM